MTTSTTDTWAVAMLATAERVLLLGPGWEGLARLLVHQGVAVTSDVPIGGLDLAPWEPDDGGAHDAVAVDLATPDRLTAALDARPGRVVTRLASDTPVDAEGLTRPWPLVPAAQHDGDDVWLAAWTVDDLATLAFARAVVGSLAARAAAMRAVADAAADTAASARRAESAAQRRAGLAEGRARATAALTDRWAASRDALESVLREARPGPGVPAGTRGSGGMPDPRALLRRWRSSSESADATGEAGAAGPLVPAGIAGPGWRVAVLAGAAADWLGGWVHATVLAPDDLPVGTLLDACDDHLDVLVIGRVEPHQQPDVVRLADEARDAGVQVVGIVAGGVPWPGFADLCDVLVGDDPDRAGPRTVTTPAPVAPLRANPIGFRARTDGTDGLVTLVTGADRDLADVARAVASHGVEPDLRGVGTGRGIPDDVAARARQLRRLGGVLDVPAAHSSHAEHARTLVGLTAAGVPVVAPALPDAVADLLGPALSATVRDARLDDLRDVTARERVSVRQRRAAQWHHTHEARWRRLAPALDLVPPSRPPVSVVVVTNRPGHLAHCAAELSRQTYRPLEVVLGTHGPAFARADVDAFVERTGLPVTVVAIDGHRTLGEGLNQACRLASGEVVVKWDDDDHYGPDHVVDLVLALQYSGATIVGKGSEFVHLGPLDVTIRRFVGNAESGSRSLAGGTLALRRDHLAAAGWWRRVPRAVDQRLLDDVERIGGTVHRTHGFGFVLARRATGHTWDIDVDYFLAGSEFQWRGLAREATGLEDSVIAVPRPGP